MIRNMTTSEPGSIQVIDRLTALLEAIARHRDPVSLKVLAADTGLHPSTAFRILASATENGLVARAGSNYRLGIRLLQLGSRVASHQDLRRDARPLMEALRDRIGETVNLTVRQGDEVVYLDRALPERMMRVEQRIGSRAPLHVTAVGKLIARAVAGTHKKVTLELGGKAANIVFDDAPLDQAIEGIINGIYFNQGEVCCAGSRLFVQESVYEPLLDKLKDRLSTLRVGDPLDKNTDVGAINSAGQLAKIAELVDSGIAEGAEIFQPDCVLPDKGFFFRPTLFTGVSQSHRIAQEEIFGPVLSIIKIGSEDEAIRVSNGIRYGLSSSIFTRDVNRAFRAMRDLQTGITYINAGTTGAEVHLPFGGMKQTGNGHREAGQAALDVFTEWKSIYVDYSGRLQRAQIDNA